MSPVRQPHAQAMLERGLRSIPVADHGRLVGIVSRRDLLRLLARNDEDIRRALPASTGRGLLSVHGT